MADRYVRPEERLARELRRQREGIRDVQRPTGTEKARTMETAEQAASDADDALRDAGDALEAALAAKTTADGRNRIFAQGTKPVAGEVPFVAGDLWYETDALGRFVSVHVWNEGAADFVPHKLVADSVLVPGSVGPVLIEDGAITGVKIAGDAIDGKTITGATVRTAATGQRMEFNVDGLQMMDASGELVASLSSSPDGVDFDLTNSSHAHIMAHGLGGSFGVETASNEMVALVADEFAGALYLQGNGSNITLFARSASLGPNSFYSSKPIEFDAPAFRIPGNSVATKGELDSWTTNVVDGTRALVTATSTEYIRRGGVWEEAGSSGPTTAWATLPRATGINVYGGKTPQWRRIGDKLYLRGAVIRASGGFGDNPLQVLANGALPDLPGIRDEYKSLRILPGNAGMSPGRSYVDANGGMWIGRSVSIANPAVDLYYSLNSEYLIDAT